jgi:hypothetical protein
MVAVKQLSLKTSFLLLSGALPIGQGAIFPG